MGEVDNNKLNAVIKFFKSIPTFVTEHATKFKQEIDAHKKRLNSSLSTIVLQKEKFLLEYQLEEEKRRLQLKQLSDDESFSSAQNIVSLTQDEDSSVSNIKESDDASKKGSEISQSAKSDFLTTPKTDLQIAQTKQEEQRLSEAELLAEEAKKRVKDAIINPIFEKVKPQEIEKPKIRIYVPPVETPRPRRNDNNSNNQFRNAHPSPNTPRPSTGPRSASDNSSTNAKFRTNSNSFTHALPVLLPTNPAGNKNATKKRTEKPTSDVKRTLDKKTLFKKGYIEKQDMIEYDEMSGEIKKIRIRKLGDKKKNNFIQPPQTVIEHAIITKDVVTVKELSEKIGRTGTEIIRELFVAFGIIKTINETIDFDTAELVSSAFNVSLKLQRTETSEEKAIAYHEDESDESVEMITRPPIVTVMGHVDHGKTSILDYIRKANVVAGEAGGITQHIGAYSVPIGDSKITFLDTPGHAAFTAMRARGANVTDIVIIVIAADDCIMPQTIEAINHAKAAKVSIIVALNKMDKPNIDPDKVYSQLSEHDLLPEEWGGSVPVIKVSAKTGMGIKELLETVLATAEINDYKANPSRKAKGTIIEARLDKGKGPVATVLVENGTLSVQDYVVVGSVTGKIRAMQDNLGRNVEKAGPSTAVSILGLQDVPEAGDQLLVVENEKAMRQIADDRNAREQEKRILLPKGISLDDVFKGITDGKLKSLNIIIKADVQGSVEAIRDSLLKLSNNEVKVTIVHAAVGAINESDIMLADTTASIIIGFNVRPDNNAKVLAERYSIDIRFYRVIYDAIDDVALAIKGLLAPKFREQFLGKAEVRETFRISGVGMIAGSIVRDGKIVRNAKVRLLRDSVVIAETKISSLKRMKDDVKEVLNGFECGIGLENFDDIKIGDVIESFSIVQEEI